MVEQDGYVSKMLVAKDEIEQKLRSEERICRESRDLRNKYPDIETEIHKLTGKLLHLEAKNENMQQMIRMQTEEKNYIEKVCIDMVKLSKNIPIERTFAEITIPTTENTTIHTLKQTMELVLHRLVEINNKKIITEQQITEKCASIANWTDLQRKEMVQDKETLQEQESKIKRYKDDMMLKENEIKQLKMENKLLLEIIDQLEKSSDANIKKVKKEHSEHIIILETRMQEEQKRYNDEIQSKNREAISIKSKLESINTQKDQKEQYRQEEIQELRERIRILEQDKTEIYNSIAKQDGYISKMVAEKDGIEQMLREEVRVCVESMDLRETFNGTTGNYLTEKNSELTHLCDPNRPVNIGKRYEELFDNEWKDATLHTEVKMLFNNTLNLEEILSLHLYALLKCCYSECLLLSQQQMQTIGTTIRKTMHVTSKGDNQDIVSKSIYEELAVFRRQNGEKTATNFLENQVLEDKIVANLTHSWKYDYRNEDMIRRLMKTQFFEKCVYLCWYMAIQDPVMFLSDDLPPDTYYDKNVFRPYTTTGDKVKYVMWPALFLYKGGPLLFEGFVHAY